MQQWRCDVLEYDDSRKIFQYEQLNLAHAELVKTARAAHQPSYNSARRAARPHARHAPPAAQRAAAPPFRAVYRAPRTGAGA